MKISVITNGISQDYKTCCKVMNETGVQYAELQEIYGKRVELLTEEEAQKIRTLNEQYGIKPVSVTTHAFAGVDVMSLEVGDATYEKHMNLLKNGIKIARIIGAPQVRAMPFTKAIVLHGAHGSDQWNASGNKAWPKFIELYRPIAKLAEEEDITITVENGFNAMIVSGYQCRKFVEELGCDKIKILWDPANALYYGDIAYPNAYNEVKDYLGHVHIKDLNCSIVEGWVDIRNIGHGMMAPYLDDIREALERDDYDGYISLENIYRPDGGDFIDGYYLDIPELKKRFE